MTDVLVYLIGWIMVICIHVQWKIKLLKHCKLYFCVC